MCFVGATLSNRGSRVAKPIGMSADSASLADVRTHIGFFLFVRCGATRL